MHVNCSLDSVNIDEFSDSRSAIRFMFSNFTGAIIPGALLVGASYVGLNETLILVLLSLGMGFMGLWYPGMKVNPLDLSPNFASTVMAVSNSIGAITGTLAPKVVAILTPHVSNDLIIK